MKIAVSKLTSQGQISVPAQVRRRLGLSPGSAIEWEAQGDVVFVRRAGKYSSADIHAEVFTDGPPQRRTLAEMDRAVADRMREKHARR